MRKKIILVGLLLVMAYSAFAEQRGVFMEIHRKSIPEKNLEVNRAPMRLPIEVMYDSDTHTITVTGNFLQRYKFGKGSNYIRRNRK